MNSRGASTVVAAALVFVVGAGIAGYAVVAARQQAAAQFEREARAVAKSQAAAMGDDVSRLDVGALRGRLQSLAVGMDASGALVADAEGLVLTDGTKENPRRDEKLKDQFSVDALRAKDVISRSDGATLRLAAPILRADGESVGLLVLDFPAQRLTEAAGAGLMRLLIAAAVAVGVGVLLVFVLGRGGEAAAPAPVAEKPRRERLAAPLVAGMSRDAVVRLLDSVSDAAVVVDGSGVVMAVNAEAVALLGHARNELVGRPFGPIIGAEKMAAADLEALVRGTAKGRVPKTFTGKGGAKLEVSLACVALPDGQGKTPDVLCLARRTAQPDTGGAAETDGLRKQIEEDRRRMAQDREALDQARREVDQERERLDEERARLAGGAGPEGASPEGLVAEGAAAGGGKAELFQWAEEELKRVRATLQRTQQRVQQLEDDVADAQRARETAERQRGQLDEELQRAHEEVERVREQLTRRPPEPAGDATRRAEAERRRLAAQLQQAQAARDQLEEQLRQVEGDRERQAQRLEQGQREREDLERRLRAAEVDRPQPAAAAPSPPVASPPPAAAPPPIAAPAPPPAPAPAQAAFNVLDRAEALAGVDGDMEFLKALIGVFLDNCPRQVAEIHAAVEHADGPALERAARTLKGTVANFGARAAGAAAGELETVAAAGNLAAAAAACAALDAELERLKPELIALRDSGA